LSLNDSEFISAAAYQKLIFVLQFLQEMVWIKTSKFFENTEFLYFH